MLDIEEMGPVDYLVVEFPAGTRFSGEAFPLLLDLVDRGIVRILDIAFVRKNLDGVVDHLSVGDLKDDGGTDLTIFDGAASGLLGPDDIVDVGLILEPGASAVILVYENTWAAPLAVALRQEGAQLVATARIPVQGILAALDAAEAAAPRPVLQ